MNIQQCVTLMAELKVAESCDLVGVSEQEVTSLEAYFGLRFPEAYRQYLLTFGRSAGYLSPWMAFYFDDLKEIRDQFDLLNIAQNNPVTLPEKNLLIANWESIFDFLVCDGQDNPPVFRVDLFDDGGASCRCYAPSFSEYLEKVVRSTDHGGLPQDFFDRQFDESMADDLIKY